MSWFPSFFRPSMAWLLALLIPIVIFYFLKLRRTRLEISSLALWRQVINDQRVNAPFQKFKRNLLLLLQILLLCLIALAAMQPFFPGEAERQNHLPILIDVSASMGAVDETGTSRLDLAKREISEIIDGLLPGQRVTLISVGATARRLTDFTDNKTVLRDALRRLQVEDARGRLEDGLRLAQALSRTLQIERVRFYSDGNLPTKPNPTTGEPMALVDFDLPFPVDFFKIPSRGSSGATVPLESENRSGSSEQTARGGPAAGNNIGITAFNARRATIDRWDVFLRVEGSRAGGTEAEVTLKANREVIGRERMVLGPGESQRMVFRVDATVANDLQAELNPVGHDALKSDNVAWLHLPPGRPLRAYCDASLPVFRHALQATEGVEVDPDDAGNQRFTSYDLLVSEQSDDAARNADLAVFVGVVPQDLQSLIRIEDEPAEVIDWQRDALILQHVQLRNVVISQQPAKQPDVDDSAIEQSGYEILAYGNRGPLLLRKREGIRLEYYFLFHTDRSTLPYRVGFPVLVSNLVTEALQQAALDELRAPSTGVLPPLALSPGETYRITSPDGRHQERTANDEGLLVGIPATRIGEYEIRSGNRVVEKFGVGLLDPVETSLLSVEKIHFNELSVAAEEERLQQDRPLWGRIALIAFCVLLFEWWYFQKRPSGVPE
jgi:Ca-activated chloride channel homolog